jgi:hypothetical protein
MQQNVGVLDQVIRVTAGFALLFAGMIFSGPAKVALLAAGLAVVISGFAGYCLLYRVLGIRTCTESG